MTAQAGSIISSFRTERRNLRQRIRAERRALPVDVRAAADRAIASHIPRSSVYRSARRIALFLAFDGEPSLGPLTEHAVRTGKRLYVPVITRSRMRFAELDLKARLSANFFGILEPRGGEAIGARELDVVFMPLVGFDLHGHRIGMGRGFYDRHFAFRRHLAHYRRPLLVGLAYAVQQVPLLPDAPHDVPLDAIVTECTSLFFARRTS